MSNWSKSDGAKIKITFSQPLVGDVSGVTGSSRTRYDQINLSSAVVTALNEYHSSHSADKTKDGDLTSYWWGTTAVDWLCYKLPEKKIMSKIRLYLGDYYVKTMSISGSDNGEVWTDISPVIQVASTTTKQWYEFEIDNQTEYLYYKINILSTYSSGRVYVYEVEFFETVVCGNEDYFTVTVPEYTYVPGGELLNIVKPVKSVYAGSTNTDVILEMYPLSRFESSAGNIIVEYAGGTLIGEGGSVEPFSVSFSPTDLAYKGDQNDEEHFEISSLSTANNLIQVFYKDHQGGDEHISINSVSVVSALTAVTDL